MPHRFCLVTIVLVIALGAGAPARAQLAVSPESLAVEVPQRQTAERSVTVTNTGSETVEFCLSFDRPLQRVARGIRLSPEAYGTACGEIGEVLLRIDQEDLPFGWFPYGLTQLPDGRLFVAEDGGIARTFELTPSLELVRWFEHPIEDEFDFSPSTAGLTYNADTESLWWLNTEGSTIFVVDRALLLEGDLDGVPTGRRIELPVADSGPHPAESGFPTAPAYDPATQRYYFLDTANETLWAVDTLGGTIPGYPVQQQVYPLAGFSLGLDAFGADIGGTEGVRLEVSSVIPGSRRLLVLDPLGNGAGPETPLPDVSDGTPGGAHYGTARSTLDPNGLAYVVFANFNTDGVLGIRPHPLPPSWLGIETWEGTLGPGKSVEIALTFRAGERVVGAYTAALQVFAASGEATEVPLTLTVLEATATEPGPPPPDVPALAVYPNPAGSRFTVRTGSGEVVVYDVLGRAVRRALVAGGRAEVSAAGLAAGVYLVRASDGATARVTIRR